MVCHLVAPCPVEETNSAGSHRGITRGVVAAELSDYVGRAERVLQTMKKAWSFVEWHRK